MLFYKDNLKTYICSIIKIYIFFYNYLFSQFKRNINKNAKTN